MPVILMILGGILLFYLFFGFLDRGLAFMIFGRLKQPEHCQSFKISEFSEVRGINFQN